MTEPTTALALPDVGSPLAQVGYARQCAKLASDIIESCKLYKVIGRRKFVEVEGWTTVARFYELSPKVEFSRPLAEGGYEARVVLVDKTGVTRSSAEAECGTRGDSEWPSRPAYAQRSMAQTRATSKACRLALSWVLVLAGYEATPAEEITEEMRSERVERVAPPPARTAPQQGQKAPTGGDSPPAQGEGLATEKQRAFIGQLAKAIGWTNTDLAEHIATAYPSAIRDGKGSTQALTVAQASELIATLQKEAAP